MFHILHYPIDMNVNSLLVASVQNILRDIVKGPIINEGKIFVEKLQKHK